MRKCPQCGEEPIVTCKCFRGDSECKNGHKWHTCTLHQKVTEGHSDHAKPMDVCTCK